MKELASLVSSYSRNKDRARREFILNIFLIASIFLAFVASVFSWILTFSEGKFYREESLEVTIIFFLFIFGYGLNRRGKFVIVSYGFILFYIIITTLSALRYGADFSQGIIIFCLIIVMSGILFSSRFAFLVSILIAVDLTIVIYLQRTGIVHPELFWRNKKATIPDGLVLGISFFVLAVVSWLSNREIERSLKRAWKSESALKQERSLLEQKVIKRTEELRKAQIEKMMQLYRFVEFGRLSAGLFHDLVTPLNLISLNLENMQDESRGRHKGTVADIYTYLRRALYGTKRLEAYINAARKQLQNTEKLELFSLTKEIEQTISLFSYKARTENVLISFSGIKSLKTYGNSVKFAQVVANILSNALDAFEQIQREEGKKIMIALTHQNTHVYLRMEDNGKGMKHGQIVNIFRPLYTTKQRDSNMGLGLFITRHIIEKDFSGTINVESKKDKRTVFTIIIPLRDEKDSSFL